MNCMNILISSTELLQGEQYLEDLCKRSLAARQNQHKHVKRKRRKFSPFTAAGSVIIYKGALSANILKAASFVVYHC